MQILSTRDPTCINHLNAHLLSAGFTFRWVEGTVPRVMVLDVPTSDAASVSLGLSAMLGEEFTRRARTRENDRRADQVPLFLQAPFVFALGFAALFVVVFWFTGTADGRSVWFIGGRLDRKALFLGEWWRLMTAATLHADFAHLAGNFGFLWLLAWAGAERVGSGMTALAWLVTAIAGFGASLLMSDVSLTVGASGGLFGLLGLVSAHAYRLRDRHGLSVRERLRTLGSGVLLLAFTGFSPGSNIGAHVGGFVAGVALAAVVPGRKPPAGLQIVLSVVTVASVIFAWQAVRSTGATN